MPSDLNTLILPGVTALVSTVILLIIRYAAFNALGKASNGGTWLGAAGSSMRSASIFWALAVGIYIGIASSNLQGNLITTISKALHVLVILSVTVVAANLSTGFMRGFIQGHDMPAPSTGLAYAIVRGVIFTIGLLVILSVLNVSIAPLITALGVGGLAVALALQDTLANLFAGIHILVEKTIRAGDYIRLESGQEGFVDDITWRTTRIRTAQNNVVIITNNKLSQSIVTNYSLPGGMVMMALPVSVGYGADTDRVEAVLLDAAREAAGIVPGLLGEPPPSVMLIPGFLESSVGLTLTVAVDKHSAQGSVQHELRKRIIKKFREESIVMPLPGRDVYLHTAEKDCR